MCWRRCWASHGACFGTEAWELFSGFVIFPVNFALPQLCLSCLSFLVEQEKALMAGLGLLSFAFD